MNIQSEAEQTDQPRRYTEEDRFGLLIQKGGGMSVVEYLKLPAETKKKVYRVFRGIRMLPDQFLTSEVQDLITQDLGMADYQRLLYMLFQGGYLTREKDHGHRIVHSKTDLVKTCTDNELAADIMSKNQVMTGFVAKTRRKKTSQEKALESKPHLQIVNAGFDEHAGVESQPFVDENPLALLSSQLMEGSGQEAKDSIGHQELQDMLKQLDEPDLLMIMDLVVSLKGMREFLPNLSRKQFLQIFIEGGRYVKD